MEDAWGLEEKAKRFIEQMATLLLIADSYAIAALFGISFTGVSCRNSTGLTLAQRLSNFLLPRHSLSDLWIVATRGSGAADYKGKRCNLFDFR